MNTLQNIGGALVALVTGSTPDQLQAEAQAAEQAVTTAIETLIALSAINTLAVIAIAVMVWKGKN